MKTLDPEEIRARQALEEVTPAIEQLQAAGLGITSIRVIRSDEEHGIPLKQWRMQEITRQCNAYLCTLSQTK